MNKQETLKKLIREEVRKELMKESKIVDLIIRLFFKGKIKKAVADLKNDPDIQEKFRAIEYALQNLKDATEREQEFYNSDARNAALKSLGVKRIKY